MREIKFRGKTPSGDWICGDIVQNTILSYPNVELGTKITWRDDAGRHYERVTDSSIGQFINALDRDGNEMYEGDIVEGLFIDKAAVIRWDLIGWMPFVGEQVKPWHVRVIGNEIDNPELIDDIE